MILNLSHKDILHLYDVNVLKYYDFSTISIKYDYTSSIMFMAKIYL